MRELDILKIVLSRLNNSKIKYMLTGSIALSYYVQPRMTRDVDIVIDVTENDIDKIYRLFKDNFYIDKESVQEAIKGSSSFNIIYLKFPTKFDFIIRKDTSYRKLELKRRKKIEIEGTRAFIVTIEDLILSKLYWAKGSHSQMQLNDVHLLLSKEGVDLQYIKEKAKELNVTSLLKDIAR